MPRMSNTGGPRYHGPGSIQIPPLRSYTVLALHYQFILAVVGSWTVECSSWEVEDSWEVEGSWKVEGGSW